MLLGIFVPALDQPPLRVVERRVLCPSTEAMQTNLIPAMIGLADGRLLAVWCSGPGPETNLERFIVAAHSTDGGRTWTEPVTIVDTPGKCDINPTLLQSEAGEVLMFYHQWEGHHETRLRRSGDAGVTWSEPEAEHPHCAVQGARALRIGPGHFVLPGHFWPDDGTNRGRAGCIVTEDDGKTWRVGKATITLEHYRGLMEPSVAPLADGTLLMAIRTCAGYVYFSRSTDNGETWAEPWPGKQFPAPQAPGRLLRTADGRLLMAYSHGAPLEPNSHKPRNALALVQSTDDGKTWSQPLLIEGQEDADIQISYPAMAQVGDEVVIIYHHQPGYVSQGTRGASEIHLARVSLR
jgi:predicted neuraminidase